MEGQAGHIKLHRMHLICFKILLLTLHYPFWLTLCEITYTLHLLMHSDIMHALLCVQLNKSLK